MIQGQERTPAYPADAFAGTAEYYARYRVPYPQAMLDDLRVRARVTGQGQLLDLACGPGRVALALSPHFSEVWAIDQEPEMIEPVAGKPDGEVSRTCIGWSAEQRNSRRGRGHSNSSLSARRSTG